MLFFILKDLELIFPILLLCESVLFERVLWDRDLSSYILLELPLDILEGF